VYDLESEWWYSKVVYILSFVGKWKFAKKVHLQNGVKEIHEIHELVVVQDVWFAYHAWSLA